MPFPCFQSYFCSCREGENRARPSVQSYTIARPLGKSFCQGVALTLNIWDLSCKSPPAATPSQRCTSCRLLHSSFAVGSRHRDHRHHLHQRGATTGLTPDQRDAAQHKLHGSTLHQYFKSSHPTARRLLGLARFGACCPKHILIFMEYCNRSLQQNHLGQHGMGRETMARTSQVAQVEASSNLPAIVTSHGANFPGFFSPGKEVFLWPAL